MRPWDLGIGALFESMRDAVIVAEANTGRIILWNETATKIFGYSSSEALELRIDALVPELLRARHQVDIACYQVMGQGPSIDSQGLLDLPALTKDGEEIRIEMSLTPISPSRNVEAEERFALAIVRDVTERKRIEEQLRESEERFQALIHYEAPFEYVRTHVKPLREANRDRLGRTYWWWLGRSGQNLRKALKGLPRILVTPTVAKHRFCVWLEAGVVPDHQLNFFARHDDYFFGVLHSWAHELWALRMGRFLGVGNDPRYTPTTCFETFPEPTEEQRTEISEAARRLDELRRNWLNPEGASAAELKKRTLTNLYNARPTWLQNPHARLDTAVFAAYGWPSDGRPTFRTKRSSRTCSRSIWSDPPPETAKCRRRDSRTNRASMRPAGRPLTSTWKGRLIGRGRR
jgi:PAS domain S-box-containing protein